MSTAVADALIRKFGTDAATTDIVLWKSRTDASVAAVLVPEFRITASAVAKVVYKPISDALRKMGCICSTDSVKWGFGTCAIETG